MYLYIDVFYSVQSCYDISYLCWMLIMLCILYLLNDKSNLPLYLKGRSGWILPNDSLEKVRKSCGVGLLSSYELMHNVSMVIAGVLSLSLFRMCVQKGNET